jgi:hypothetical protein
MRTCSDIMNELVRLVTTTCPVLSVPRTLCTASAGPNPVLHRSEKPLPTLLLPYRHGGNLESLGRKCSTPCFKVNQREQLGLDLLVSV